VNPDAFEQLVRTRFADEPAHRLSQYYRFVMKWNPRLHLTTITEPREFFTRHVVESALVAERILTGVDQVWDIGSGVGVPGLIVAILRPDLAVHLVEASRKKTIFLEEAVAEAGLSTVRVVQSRFESLPPLPESACLSVRAIEGMERMIPALVRMGANASQMVFLGAKDLENPLRSNLSGNWQVEPILLPDSEHRYLILAQRFVARA
jgi:16S rRNA (guanine527-N7)-methyltransferase